MDCAARPSTYLGPLSVLPESRLEAGPLLPAPLLPQLDTALDLKMARVQLLTRISLGKTERDMYH